MSPALCALMMRLLAAGYFVLGVLFALVTVPALAAPGLAAIDLLKWPYDGDPAALSQEAAWFSAASGGVVAAFSVMMFTIVAPALERGDAAVRRGATAAIIAWFVIDSAGSVASGVASNAAFNVIFLALYMIPVIASARAGERRG